MNCDDVFDALTDPTLSPSRSADLEAHLARCPRCRQFREVIEPARSLLCGELPIERLPGQQSSTETGTFSGTRSLLTVESVGMAEAIASQLATSGRKSRPPRWSFANPRFVAVVRGTALVLFGALAVYCLGPRDRESDLHAIPAVVPAPLSARTCTRMDFQRRNASARNAQQVVLTCVACHMKDGAPQRQPGATSGFWPARRMIPSIRLAIGEGSRVRSLQFDRSEPFRDLIS
jgi:anti-sigma factor RsiW